MTDGQVIGYAMNCGKTEETTESYERTCTKTPEDVDYYEKTCGMEEGDEIYLPDPPPEDSGNSGGSSEPVSSGDGNGGSGEGDTGNEPEPVQTPSPVIEPVVMPSPSVIPAVEEVIEQTPVRKKQTVIEAKASQAPEEDMTSPSPSALPQTTLKPAVVEKVELPQAAAQPEDEGGEPLVLKRKWAVFTPVIRMISITSGTLLLLAGMAVLLFYLRRSVRVYNDNGKGRMKYLGRAAVTLSEEGYYITITDKLMEHAATNRYCIRPDLFLIGKNSSWEICIVKDGKKKSVYLDKEMTFTI